MQDTEDVDPLADQVDGVVAGLRRGAVTALEAEQALLALVECALDGDADDPAATVEFIDYALGVVLELSDEPRVGRATMYDTVRSHLDRLTRRADAAARLDERVAAVRVGLVFDCDSEHLELIRLCREGRAEDPLLYADAERAEALVGLAAEFEVVRALEAALVGGEDSWQRLGQHHSAWLAAFDALASIAWNPANARSREARSVLLELLAHPHTALDAAVRIQPAWLRGDDLHQALNALDRVEAWIILQPSSDPGQDARFGAIRHAVTSLVWLAQDAQRSAEVHALWGRH